MSRAHTDIVRAYYNMDIENKEELSTQYKKITDYQTQITDQDKIIFKELDPLLQKYFMKTFLCLRFSMDIRY